MDLLCLHALLVLLCSILLYFSLYSTLSNETLKVMVPPRRSGRSNKEINRNCQKHSRPFGNLPVNTFPTNSEPNRSKNHHKPSPTESKKTSSSPKRKASHSSGNQPVAPVNTQQSKIPKPNYPENPNSASGVAPPATDVTFPYCLSTSFFSFTSSSSSSSSCSLSRWIVFACVCVWVYVCVCVSFLTLMVD